MELESWVTVLVSALKPPPLPIEHELPDKRVSGRRGWLKGLVSSPQQVNFNQMYIGIVKLLPLSLPIGH